MPMESSWAEALIGRLFIRYGEAFMRQWPGMDRATVAADWAEVLDGVRGESIRYALDNLPPDRPPNALQFRELCRRARMDERQVPALSPPQREKLHPAVAKELRAVVDRLKANPVKPSAAHLAASRGAAVSVPGDYRPIAEHLLPPGMRNGGIVRDVAAGVIAQHERGEWVDPGRLDAARRISGRCGRAECSPDCSRARAFSTRC